MGAISFPNLGISINPSPVAFTVAGKDIYWYGIIIAAGFVLAVLYAMKRASQFGLTEDHILDMLFAAVPAAIVCARLYYCLFYWELYADDPISILYIWEGGLAIYGGVIGAVLAVVIFCKVRKMPIGPMIDIGGLGLLIGQMIGRWGNFMNREAFGEYTDNLFAMRLPIDAVRPWDISATISENIIEGTNYIQVHPTFLYESAWNLLIFCLLIFYRKYRKFHGETTLLYLGGYGLGRCIIEGLRTDQLLIPGTELAVSQMLAGALVVFSVAAWWLLRTKQKQES